MDESAASPRQSIPRAQQIIAVLWPSFLTSGVATALFFTVFDPAVLLAAVTASPAGS